MASSVHALRAVLFSAAQDAQDGAVTHFWMRVPVQGAAHDLFDVRSELGSPCEHPLGRPAAVVLMTLRSMLGQSDGSALASVAAMMACDANPAVPALDGAGRGTHVDELLAEPVGDAVVASVELDVVVDVGARGLALSHLESQRWQRLHRRQVQCFEGLTAIARELLKVSLIQLLDELRDSAIERGQAVESAIAKPCKDPALGDQHTGLDLGLAFRLSWWRRKDHDAVVLRQLVQRVVDVRVVAVGAADGAAQLIGHENRGHCAEVLEGAHDARGEVWDGLRERDLGKGVVAGTEHGDEQLDFMYFARFGVGEAGLIARVIDEQLSPGRCVCRMLRRR
jgi:hypothetical protein